jgi:putative ABC transport system ATP-binding protein
VLQDYGIIEDESVAFNVTMRSQGARRAQADRTLVSALKRTGLADRRDELAAHLSGGEKQRLAVARAIYRNASVLLVDEPTASLDADNRHAVIDLFTEFAREGATVIVSTHDEGMIAACDTRHELAFQPHESKMKESVR